MKMSKLIDQLTDYGPLILVGAALGILLGIVMVELLT